ncbi:MAG: LptF/LptG family permease [Chthoniobacteraceae bacterium]
MKLIDRYIGREILVTALFAVGVLSFVLVLGNVFKQLLDLLVNHDVPIQYILTFIAYILPFSLTFTIPWGFLTAVLLVFGKLSAENELIALKSCGVSIPRICVPLLFMSLICVGICLWINLDVAPRAQEKMRNTLFSIVTEDPLSMFGSDHVIDDFPGRKIYVEKKDGKDLHNILVYELDKDSNPVKVVFAKKGQLETNLQDMAVYLHISDARFEERDASTPTDFNKVRQGILMKESVFSISLKELYEKNQQYRPQNKTFRGIMDELSKTEILPGSPPAWDKILRTVLRTELNKRFAFSLASLALALIAVPLAITAHRKETSIGFFFSLIVGFSYFFFIDIASTLQNNPKWHPELLIWLPNVIFISIGSFMFWRLARK